MRLISQDGMIDVPYENTIINCEKNKADSYTIYAEASHCFGLAVYSNTDKALKVMEMLREEYLQYCTARSSEYWFAFNNPKVFKFPDDSEVEV